MSLKGEGGGVEMVQMQNIYPWDWELQAFYLQVEKILDKRMKKGKAEYLIKWKGEAIF